MRHVLPGGATLSAGNSGGKERLVVCRRLAVVVVRTVPRRPADPPPTGAIPAAAPEGVSDRFAPSFAERLNGVKLLLEVLMVLVGLIGAILALFGWSKK